MALRRKKPEPQPLTEAEIQEQMRMRRDPRYTLETYFRVEDRDRKGWVIPWKFRSTQARCYETICDIQAYNVAQQLTEHKAWNLFRQISGHDVAGLKLRDQVRAIRSTAHPEACVWDMWALDPDVAEWLTSDPIRLLILKARQQGFSTLTEGLFAHKVMFTSNVRALVLAHELNASENILGFIRTFYDNWPNNGLRDDNGFPAPGNPIRMRPLTISDARDRYVFDHHSRMLVQTAGGLGKSPRSFRFDVGHLSEFAHYPNEGTVASLASGLPDHAWVIKESTANGPGGAFYEEYQNALHFEEAIQAIETNDLKRLSHWQEEGQGYFRFFNAWFEDPSRRRSFAAEGLRDHLLATLSEYEQSLIDAFKLDAEQLNWRRNTIPGLRNSSGLTREAFFMQEHPATPDEAFQSSGSRVFDAAKMSQMKLRAQRHVNRPISMWRLFANSAPQEVSHFHEANFFVWEPPRPGNLYIAGVDVAQGLASGDFSVVKVFDRMDGIFAREVACFWGKPDATSLGDLAIQICELFNRAFMVPEKTGPGLATVSRVQQLRYPNVYHTQSFDLVKIDAQDINQFRLGFNTTPQSKDKIITDYVYAIDNELVELRHLPGIDEMISYERSIPKGSQRPRYSAPSGRNDDHVIGGALAWHGHVTPGIAPAVSAVKRKQAKRKQPTLSDEDQRIVDLVRKQKAKVQREAKRARRIKEMGLNLR